MTADDASGREDVRDLLGAYALDAVDDVERRAVERLVERDPAVARELAELRATAAMLGFAVAATPPASLRADVLSRITGTAQLGTAQLGTAQLGTAQDGTAPADGTVPATDGAVPVQPTPAGPDPEPAPGSVSALAPHAGRPPRRATTWLAVAATALGAAAIPSALAVQQARQADLAEAQAQAVAELLADPDAVVVRGEVEGGGAAVGVLADDRALFTATGLTDPGAGRGYQLWVIRDGVALPEAVMPDVDGQVRGLAEDYRVGDGLAVTVEPTGGSQEPTTDPVVLLASEV